MPEFLSSGSAIERSLICGASVALPHAHYESPYTRRGSAIHEFLEACSKVGREDALKLCEDEWREVCEALNLDGLEDALNLAAEVSFAYNFETDTARELGRGEGRKYDDVTDNEIPCTLDVVGVRELAAIRRGKYVEYKSGWSTRRRIGLVAQIPFGALCVARAYGCDIVDGELVHVHEDVQPWVQRIALEAWELDAFASEIREHAREWKALRARFIAGDTPRDFTTGEWCERCPAREFCPAMASLVRHALNARDDFDGPLRTGAVMESMRDDQLARLLHDVREAKSVLKLIEGRIIGIASARPIYLGKTPDGLDRWMGTVVGEGHEKLDGEHVFDALCAMPPETWRDGLTGEDVAMVATKVTATKKDVDAAVKGGVARGKKAGVLRELYKRLEAIPGAITTKVNTGVKEYTTKPRLEAGDEDRYLAAAEADALGAPDAEEIAAQLAADEVPSFPELAEG